MPVRTLLGLCFALSLPAAHGETLQAIFARMDQAASSFKGVSAKIRRVSHTAVINEDTTDSGVMFLKRTKPKDIRMLVDLVQPDQKSVMLQGRKLDMYFPKIQTVQEFDVGKNRELLDQFFLIGFGTNSKELEKAYIVRLLGPEDVASQKATLLELTPRSQQVSQHLKKFELWISDATGYPVQQKFYLPGGDYMLVTYTDMKPNPDLPDSALKLKLPKGVKWEYPQK